MAGVIVVQQRSFEMLAGQWLKQAAADREGAWVHTQRLRFEDGTRLSAVAVEVLRDT
jgi:hypothetical protein